MEIKTIALLTTTLCFACSTYSFTTQADNVSATPHAYQTFSSNHTALTLNTALDLKSAIHLALERNPDMHITQQRIAIAQSQVQESLAVFYPQVKGRISYDYSNNPARVFAMIVAQRDFQPSNITTINTPGGRSNFRPEITANISLFNGGQDYYRYKTTQLGVEISELESSTLHNNLIQMVTDNYYALLVAKENRLIALRSKDAVNRELKNAEIRFQAGSVLKSDVLSLRVRHANTEEWLIQATNGIEMAKTGLRTLLNLNSFSPVETIQQNNTHLPSPPNSINDAFISAEANRPEIQMAAKQIKSQEQQVKIAQGAHLPRVNAYVSYGANSQNGSINSNQDNVSTGISLEMDLFSGFASQQRIQQEKMRLKEARLQAQKIQLQIHQEVNNTYLALMEALQRHKVSTSSVIAADEAFRLVTAQFQAGTATVTRYIEAEAARDQAEARSIAARFDTLRAYAALQRVTGTWN